MKKIKVYHSAGGEEYSNFITNRELVKSVDEADLVVFIGGADVNPQLYGEPTSPHTMTSAEHDEIDLANFKRARKLGKKLIGICRGHQFLNAMNGGKMVQHSKHPGQHSVYLENDKVGFKTNSLHHQMAYPFNLPKEDYTVLAYTKYLSPMHLGGKFEELPLENGNEVEALWMPKINAFTMQWHPEMMFGSRQLHKEMFAWINKQIEEKLGLIVE